MINQWDIRSIGLLLILGTFTFSCTSPGDRQPEPSTDEPVLSIEEALPPTEEVLPPIEKVLLPTERPLIPTEETVPIIWDDDGSLDGVTALLYLLQHPSYEVKAATISPGIAHPDVFAPNLVKFLASLGVEGIQVAAGREQPLSGDNAFPDQWRLDSDEFWGLDLPDGGEPTDDRNAAQLIVDVIKASEQPVTVFVGGPLTNLAEALRMDPTIKDGIRSLEIMGGAVNVPGNVFLAGPDPLPAEWNIYIDPVAASEVFSSGLHIRLNPLDATDRIRWSHDDANTWGNSNSPESSIATQLLTNAFWTQKTFTVLIWDLVAAINAADRDLCEWQELFVEVVLEETDNQGQIVVIGDQGANVSACMIPDRAAYKNAAQQMFGTPP